MLLVRLVMLGLPFFLGSLVLVVLSGHSAAFAEK
jgi:hypothetical protein